MKWLRPGPSKKLDDWLQADREPTWTPPIESTEQENSPKLRAAVAGFEHEELDVLIRSERAIAGS